MSVTEVAFVVITIPGSLRSDSLDICVARQLNHWLRDDVVSVEAADTVIQALAVDFGVGTKAGLEMGCYARSSSESILAEGTLD